MVTGFQLGLVRIRTGARLRATRCGLPWEMRIDLTRLFVQINAVDTMLLNHMASRCWPSDGRVKARRVAGRRAGQ